MHVFNYLIYYNLDLWVVRDQTQPGSFSWERKEPGNEVGWEEEGGG